MAIPSLWDFFLQGNKPFLTFGTKALNNSQIIQEKLAHMTKTPLLLNFRSHKIHPKHIPSQKNAIIIQSYHQA
ncbi:hypothetical protein G7K_5167-t1 [Saitoella complicata NRRL Y-17804]|uniref:Uncharacterized protein n=1 Tax=Saitoella complicata (strain BCRC 22490 / CBS 7301 / JCM 7358 / NBRC 10748 / NRRL Y-17804) TaxID=698492 RepID=A0A0E9NNQ5_SAICN|nr:hypothetical protein G7K_5167-t1 [Saitoella complicata NRRL Y-17804]